MVSAPPSVETLKNMVLRENALRLSPEWQARFAAAERTLDTDWLDCVEELQQEVVQEFGLQTDAVHFLQTAQSLYPEESFFREVPLYVKYNRARNGPLHVGAKVQDVPIVQLDGTRTPLLMLGGNGRRPLVLIGGSRS